jgi:hypothetical protein
MESESLIRMFESEYFTIDMAMGYISSCIKNDNLISRPTKEKLNFTGPNYVLNSGYLVILHESKSLFDFLLAHAAAKYTSY